MGLSSRLVINRFEYKLSKKRGFKGIDDIIDEAYLQLVGIVPNSDELKNLSSGKIPKQKSKPMKAFIRIAKRLLGENILLPKVKKI
jgi:septum formation inhibitor-activating ATPase MinD